MSSPHRPRLAAVALVALACLLPTAALARPSRQPDLGAAMTRFGLDAYAHLRDRPGNLAFSPASIFSALALLHAGAGGRSATTLATALHLDGWDAPALDAASARWLDAMTTGTGAGAAFELASGIWVRADTPLTPAFWIRAFGLYHAGAATADFAGAPDAERRAINAWIAAHTGDRIRDLLPPDSVDASTRLILANAIHFLGHWDTRFPLGQTRDEPFHLADGTTATVPLMHLTHAERYGDAGDATILELPYRDTSLAMLVVLPAPGQPLASIERDLSPATLGRWLGATAPSVRVAITLPRFAIDQRTGLKDLFTDLGLASTFTQLDLRPMLGATDALALDDAVHQTVITVDEQGTEAAAATAVKVQTAAAVLPPTPFTADRPFLWMIRDTATGAIVFMGRLDDPR